MAKVSRWIKQLSDREVVELTHRVLRSLSTTSNAELTELVERLLLVLARTIDIDAGALRAAYLQFIQDYPQQRLAEKGSVV